MVFRRRGDVIVVVGLYGFEILLEYVFYEFF